MAASEYTQSLPPGTTQFAPRADKLDKYTTMHPALHTFGLIYAEGDILATGCVIFQPSPGHFVNC